MMSEAPTLPGLDLGSVVEKMKTDYEDLSKQEVTALRLAVSHPDRYAIAARLYFEMNVSKRAVCDICKIGINTLNALIEREALSRGGEVLRQRAKAKKNLIKLAIVDQIGEAVESGALGDFKLDEQLRILEKFESLTKSDEEAPKKTNGNTSEPETIEADYRTVANGLNP